MTPFRPRLTCLDDRITPSISFATPVATAGNTPYATAIDDFNIDGRMDLASTNPTGSSFSVRLNTTVTGSSAISFGAANSFAAGATLYWLATADLNGDGRPDIVAPAGNSNPEGALVVLTNTTPLNAPTPSFAPRQSFAIGAGMNSLAVVDINLDGRFDLAVTTSNNTVAVLLNTTAVGSALLSFAAPQAFAVGNSPYAAVAADFNADGRTDLAVTNSTGSSFSILLNTTPVGGVVPMFAAQQTFGTGAGPTAVTAADVNGDGRPDVAVANYNGGAGNTVSVRLNTTAAGAATATFSTEQAFTVDTAPSWLTSGDFDGDGRLDLAVTTALPNAAATSNTVSVLPNTTAPGASTASFGAPVSTTVGLAQYSIAANDLNGDGRLDIVTTGSLSGGAVTVLRNTSTDVAVTGPVLVGQFGTTGVWRYNRVTNTWANLTGANATALAAAPNGNVVANFGGNGVWYYRPTSGWVQLNGVSAAAVGIDALGNVFVSFPGYGVARYRLATNSWTILTGAVADKLAVSGNGDVIVNFPGYGVYRYNPSTNWVSLATPDATVLAVGENGDIAANFGAYGVYRFKAGTWTLINSNPATALAVGANGAVAASFGGFGVARYIPYANGWQSLHTGTQAPSLAVDVFGNVFATLSGFGVYEFRPAFGWVLRRNLDAGTLRVG